MSESNENLEMPATSHPAAEPAAKRAPRLPDYVDLFFKPSRFFDGRLDLNAVPNFYLVAWLMGMANVADRLLGARFVTSWPWFWVAVAGLGVLAAIVGTWIGGMLYALRIEWSGGKYEGDEAVGVFVHQNLVTALPVLLSLALVTFAGTSPRKALEAHPALIGLTALVAIAWSIGVSYRAVMTRFRPTRWKAVLWFIVAPIALMVAIGSFTTG